MAVRRLVHNHRVVVSRKLSERVSLSTSFETPIPAHERVRVSGGVVMRWRGVREVEAVSQGSPTVRLRDSDLTAARLTKHTETTASEAEPCSQPK